MTMLSMGEKNWPIPCGYQTLGPDGTILRMNETALKWLGYSSEEIDGKKKFGELLVPACIPNFDQHLKLLERQASEVEVDLEIVCKDGSLLPVSLYTTPLQDGTLFDGAAFQSVLFNMSRRKRLEEAMRESAGQLRLQNSFLKEMVQVATLHENLGEALDRINQSAAKALQVARAGVWTLNEEKTKLLCMDLQREEVRDSFIVDPDLLAVPIRLRDQVIGQMIYESAGCPRVWTEEEKHFARTAAEIIAMAMETFERKFERKKLNQRLETHYAVTHALESARGKQEAIQKVLETLGVREDWEAAEFLAQCPSGNVLCCSRFWQKPGLPLGELKLKAMSDQYALGEGLPGRVWNSEIPVCLEEGEWGKSICGIPVRVDGEPKGVFLFFDREGRCVEEGTQTMLMEVGRQVGRFLKRMETEEKVEAQKQCIAIVTHELKAPMVAIREALSIILDGLEGPVSASQQVPLDIAKRNADRLLTLVADILNYGKLGSGRMEYRYERVDLKWLAAEVYQLMKFSSDKKGIRFSLSVPEDAVAADCDPEKMREVLVNLVNNAVKFTPEGKSVQFRLEKTDRNALFQVRDEGIGIAPEDQKKLFEMFGMVCASAPKGTKGSGLGLAISRQIVEGHGGSISVESSPGLGSCFSVLIPLERERGQ